MLSETVALLHCFMNKINITNTFTHELQQLASSILKCLRLYLVPHNEHAYVFLATSLNTCLDYAIR